MNIELIKIREKLDIILDDIIQNDITEEIKIINI
tara:strand:- start:156 stop:257 length:102 start_codon:yes stop_codon:yes gene_type:complete